MRKADIEPVIIERFRSGVVSANGRVTGPGDRDGIRLPLRLPDAEFLCQVLATRGLSEDNPGTKTQDPEQIAMWLHLKELFRSRRWINWVLLDDDGNEQAIFTSLERSFRPASHRPVNGLILSRFGYITREGSDLVLLSPETPCRMTLSSPSVLETIWQSSSEIGFEQADDPLCVALGRFGFLESAQAEEPQDRASWTLADAILHSTSRRGRDEPIVGNNSDLQTRFPAPPARAALTDLSKAVVLETHEDASAVKAQQSSRTWNAKPVPLSLLACFLQRLSKVDQRFTVDGLERVKKPIPAAGSIHELEWYVAAGKVSGLQRGLYRYCGHDHALEPIPNSSKCAETMLSRAKAAMGHSAERPPVLVVLSTRMSRIGWKYKGMAYRLTLLNAGVAIGAMYDAAAELGLGGCAIGTGDPRPFEQATGLRWFEETPVAEFALGLSE